jgi:hypothetical protein
MGLVVGTVIMLLSGWWLAALALNGVVLVSLYVVHLRRQRRKYARRATGVRNEASDPVAWVKAQQEAASAAPVTRSVTIRPLAEARAAALASSGSVVVDILSPRGASTLIASPGCDTVLHHGTGGAVGASSASPAVAPLTESLLSSASSQCHLFAVAAESFTAPGAVRLVLVTPSGLVAADVSSSAFNGSEPHPLSPTLAAARQLIAQLQATPDQRW